MWGHCGRSGSGGVTGPRCRQYVGAVLHVGTRLTKSQKVLQGEFGEGTLTDAGAQGLWDDVSANLVRLMAVGPPAEEMVILWEAEVVEVEETLLLVQERVCTTTALKLELTLTCRSCVTSAGKRKSLVLGAARAPGCARHAQCIRRNV